MCGRYGFYKDHVDSRAKAIVTMLEKLYPDTPYKTGEIFPGDTAPAVVERAGKILPVPAVFGFPGYRKNQLIINARAETAAQKPAFAESLRQRRVVLPANGFFEWSHNGPKTKYYFTADEAEVIYLCGLYRFVEGSVRFVILKRPADGSMLGIHDRMPVIVPDRAVRAYLTDREAAMEILSAAAPALRRREAPA